MRIKHISRATPTAHLRQGRDAVKAHLFSVNVGGSVGENGGGKMERRSRDGMVSDITGKK